MIHSAEELIPILAIGLPFVFGVCWLGSTTVTNMFRTFCEDRIKSKLIDRGASVEEIERVMAAGNPPRSRVIRQPVPPVKTAQPHPY